MVRRAGWIALGPVALVLAILLGSPAWADPASPGGSAPAPPSAVVMGQRGIVVPPVVEDVEHMCALLTSCEGLPIPASLVPADFGACVRQMASDMTSPAAIAFSLMLRECGLGSNSCNELRTCALRGAKSDTCAGRGKQTAAGFCDTEGRAVSCYHERIQAVRDCPRGGEQCAARQGDALCTLGVCPAELKEGEPPVCSASGTRILRCEHGQMVSLDCTAFGLACGAGPSGPSCVPRTPACAAGSKRCEGNESVSCYAGHEVRVECGAAGLECPASPGAATLGACMSPAPTTGACDSQAAARCDGANIKYCNLGKPRSYLCKSLGFSRCGAAGPGGGVRCL